MSGGRPYPAPGPPRPIIDLQARREARSRYDARCRDIAERLLELDRAVSEAAVDLAVLGVWRGWAEDEAADHDVAITAEALRQTGDPHVRSLVGLRDEIWWVLAGFGLRPPDEP